jgi:short-subunit dehydrogenase
MSGNNTVLITGASSGIGYELARVFAANHYNLILVARSEAALRELADEVIMQYKIRADIIIQDLSLPGAAQRLFESVSSRQLQVDILVNNAGAGTVGMFHETDEAKDLEIIQLNITALTQLTKLFSREMIKRGCGKILNVASTGSFSPGPFIAVYYATKAYVLSLSEALYRELRPHGILVSTLCPGATKTNFANRAGKRDAPGAMSADKVARLAYEGLIKNRRIIIPGLINKVLVRLPRQLVSSLNFKSQQKLAVEKG